jgi:hypothetical protein
MYTLPLSVFSLESQLVEDMISLSSVGIGGGESHKQGVAERRNKERNRLNFKPWRVRLSFEPRNLPPLPFPSPHAHPNQAGTK